MIKLSESKQDGLYLVIWVLILYARKLDSFIIALYSFDHLNKHFRSFAVSLQNVKGAKIMTRINSTLLFNTTVIFYAVFSIQPNLQISAC